MKIFNAETIKRIDEATITNEPLSSLALMERASSACSDYILNSYKKHFFTIVIGAGNNAGDGLAIARQLIEAKKQVQVIDILPEAKKTKDFEENKKLLLEIIAPNNYIDLFNIESLLLNETDIIIDAIFGIGINRPSSGIVKQVIEKINQSGKTVISIDIPSGLYPDKKNDASDIIIEANETLTFQFLKLAFLFAENHKYTGEIKVLDITLHKKTIASLPSQYHFTQKNDIKLKTRSKFQHKGNFGHSLLIAGSYGKMGACILATKACLKSGTGLLTAHIPETGVVPMQSAVPESMLSIDSNTKEFASAPEIKNYDAIGIGPGIGTNANTAMALKKLLLSSSQKLVLDADALNIISQNKDLFDVIPHQTIITPHPKEFDRLFGSHTKGHSRFLTQIEMSKKHTIIIVLKGHYTSVSLPNGEVHFNSTGNPGMATAGSGDVLTGVILSLLAQGYTSKDAAIFGSYIHGLAGNFAKVKQGEISLIASDIIDNLPNALKQLA